MATSPEIIAMPVGEVFSDQHGQYWSQGRVSVQWPPAHALSGPRVIIEVVAQAAAQMTLDDLRGRHLSAAHNVLSDALLAVEARLHPQLRRKRRAK
jgi:hypothetical protein